MPHGSVLARVLGPLLFDFVMAKLRSSHESFDVHCLLYTFDGGKEFLAFEGYQTFHEL